MNEHQKNHSQQLLMSISGINPSALSLGSGDPFLWRSLALLERLSCVCNPCG